MAPEREPLLDRYRLEKRPGGRLGVVWSAWDEKLEREVAVKLMRRDGGDALGSSARRGGGPAEPSGNRRPVRARGRRRRPLLVSESFAAELADLERERALSDRDVARIGAALCEALEHAHARGVIHRDVKPQNVMVVAEPAAGRASRSSPTSAWLTSPTPTASRARVTSWGRSSTWPPSRRRAARPRRRATCSLALTLHEAWTGANPVRGRGPAATAKKIGRQLPSLGARRRDLPPDLCDVIDDALEADPG